MGVEDEDKPIFILSASYSLPILVASARNNGGVHVFANP